MRVIEHGSRFNGYEHTVVCPACGAKMIVTLGDLHWTYLNGRSEPVPMVECPECYARFESEPYKGKRISINVYQRSHFSTRWVGWEWVGEEEDTHEDTQARRPV